MGTDCTGAGITGTDTTGAAPACTDTTGTGAIGLGRMDGGIMAMVPAGTGTVRVVAGPITTAIIDPGITTRPMCTFPTFTCQATTYTWCFLCPDGRACTESTTVSAGGVETGASFERLPTLWKDRRHQQFTSLSVQSKLPRRAYRLPIAPEFKPAYRYRTYATRR